MESCGLKYIITVFNLLHVMKDRLFFALDPSVAVKLNLPLP